MKAIICVGVSASGKTTWAKEHVSHYPNTVVVSRDDIRRHILETRTNRALNPGELWKLWKFKEESLVTQIADSYIAEAARSKKDVIIADTNLNEKFRVALYTKLTAMGYKVEYHDFPISFEEACKRDAGRPDGVGVGVIWNQFKQWHQYIGGFTHKHTDRLDSAVIFDMDGTLATMNGRGPFEWDKVDQDEQNVPVVLMLKSFWTIGHTIIIMSGRDAVSRAKTESWLKRFDIPYEALYMRAENDSRKDSVIKEELFAKYIEGKYNVILAVDDRPQMTRQWELMGIPVARMANQYNEF